MARSLNGSSQYCHASSAVATAPPIAMSCWFWADPTIAQEGTLLAMTRPSPGLDRFELRVDNSPTVVEALSRDGSSFSAAASTATYTFGTWHHAFGVWYSSTDRQVWLDGGAHGTNGVSRLPTSIGETCLGAARVSLPFTHFKGRIAEAAVWAGSGVENIGAPEAAMLAAGLSPRCLGRWLPRLVLYQDLLRPINRPGIGPVLTEVNSPAVVEHPRVIYPVNQQLRRLACFRVGSPFASAASAVEGGRAGAGGAAVAGTQQGTTIPLGEVAS